MTRKRILLFQLSELRNEMADALADLTAEQLVAVTPPGHRSVGWIACHCMHNWTHFIEKMLAARSRLWDTKPECDRYAWTPPEQFGPPPDFSAAAETVDLVCRTCIERVEGVDDAAFDAAAANWDHQNYETFGGNCVRVINHTNAHLRQIWMLRGAMGDTGHFPTQTLYKRPNENQGVFYIPDRETVLADRARER
jgi:hypothetical protein